MYSVNLYPVFCYFTVIYHPIVFRGSIVPGRTVLMDRLPLGSRLGCRVFRGFGVEEEEVGAILFLKRKVEMGGRWEIGVGG